MNLFYNILREQGIWVWLVLSVFVKDYKNFSEPEKFKPERFDPDGEEEKNRYLYVYIFFGIGLRVCIGQKFVL